MAYPYSKSETIADGAVHVIGLLFAIPASALLMIAAVRNGTMVPTTAIYVACLLLAFGASAAYHLTPADGLRRVLHRVDHAAIYLKIAGTYTPLVATIGTGFAYAVLAFVWALAGLGAVAKLWFAATDAKWSLWLYLGMGWVAVLLIWPMWHSLSGLVLALIVIGGSIYSAGTWVFAHPGMRFQNAIWHVFVLVASACLFGAVALSV